MSLATLSERLEWEWADVARDPTFPLIEKFEIINRSIRTEHLWECRVTPQVPYET